MHTLSSRLLFPWRIGSEIQVLIYQTTISNQPLLIVYVPDSAARSVKDRKNAETGFEESSEKSFPICITIPSSHHASTCILYIFLPAQIQETTYFG